MDTVDMPQAQAEIWQLVARAAAGEEIVISDAGQPVARIVPLQAKPKREIRLGLLAGQGYWIGDDFDDELPGDLLKAFEGDPS